MPQLSPMMGFIMFLTVLGLYLVFLSAMSKAPAKVSNSKMETLKKPSFVIFK
uniref:ATP synthase F0 subunit 8 n=1 Tax=Coryphella verrucosa TaxID=2059235 RepID=UPI002551E814|nr:ATP synthase F0 subunit 8 [Coryphella verrucosa]WFQ82016.1 ATP synthase F0 subunit 8 [Coryphella verrucosa]